MKPPVWGWSAPSITSSIRKSDPLECGPSSLRYPAWLSAIQAARRRIYFESSIVNNDHVGRGFAEALAERGRAGVIVRVVYDWMGAFGDRTGPRRVWRPVREAGGEVRCFNSPRLLSPLGWLSRDHRKMIP
ncbi:MAG TPA: hypothetical protein VIX63_17055 [Vicinamibacterales bacterium]